MLAKIQLICISLLSTFFLCGLAQAQQLWLPKAPKLILPQFSEATHFKADFCGQVRQSDNSVNAGFPREACVGHMILQNSLSVRAIVLVSPQGDKQIYLENGLPGVELLHPAFTILGPLNSNQKATVGKTQLSIDDQGEVVAMYIEIAPYGLIEVTQTRVY